jgi:hypothetical protein
MAMKIKIIKNKYDDARRACEKWLAGSLWGNPIYFSDQNFHVYGNWRRDWSCIWVRFLRDTIEVVRLIKQEIDNVQKGN